ncbi:MAG: PfkB family carbohydrate kinase [Phycisphaerales bacterium]
MKNKIITLGLSPAWDKTIEVADIDWNEHKVVASQKLVPAGKALNINKALAWMDVQSTAAGLWGSEDFAQMKKFVGADPCVCPRANTRVRPYIDIKLTKVPGRTRENITIVDLKNKRQMHLRSKSTLANPKTIKILKRDLQKIITKGSLAVFAGAMPDGAAEVIEMAKKKGASVVVDSSGPAFKKIVAKGGLFLIKPNVEELSELVGKTIKNEEKEIVSAAKKLLAKVKYILVSRGEKGAMLISNESVISAKYVGKKHDVYNTVACGDYLLAGFINVIARSSDEIGTTKQSQSSEKDLLSSALKNAVISATAKAFGLNEKLEWEKIQRKIRVDVKQ